MLAAADAMRQTAAEDIPGANAHANDVPSSIAIEGRGEVGCSALPSQRKSEALASAGTEAGGVRQVTAGEGKTQVSERGFSNSILDAWPKKASPRTPATPAMQAPCA